MQLTKVRYATDRRPELHTTLRANRDTEDDWKGFRSFSERIT